MNCAPDRNGWNAATAHSARTFEFAAQIDVEADLANVVLTVTLPKAPVALLRKREVQ